MRIRVQAAVCACIQVFAQSHYKEGVSVMRRHGDRPAKISPTAFLMVPLVSLPKLMRVPSRQNSSGMKIQRHRNRTCFSATRMFSRGSSSCRGRQDKSAYGQPELRARLGNSALTSVPAMGLNPGVPAYSPIVSTLLNHERQPVQGAPTSEEWWPSYQ